MKQLYLDLFSGISGDMFVGALIDLGVDVHALELELRKLPVEGYHLHARRTSKQGIAGTKFDVHVEHYHAPGGESHGHAHDQHHGAAGAAHSHPERHAEPGVHSHEHSHHHEHSHAAHHDSKEEHGHEHHHDHSHGDGASHPHCHEHGRSFQQIEHLIQSSGLSGWVKTKSIAVFRRIAVAEGKVHGLPPEAVEFHEVGAVDSIVDIVGACIGLELLGKPMVIASRVVDGSGWIECAHGRFPVPAPATLAILGERGIPVDQTNEPQELITPTGAALLAEFAASFAPMRNVVAEKIGFGLGTRDNRTRPNVLRAVLGPAASGESQAHDWEIDTVILLESNLDDVTGEVLGWVLERALSEGALDAWHTPIQMKKNRPGVLFSLLCDEQDADRFSAFLLTETTGFGVRQTRLERKKLRRHFIDAQTPYGKIAVKIGSLDGKAVQVAPEFDQCKKAAEHHGVSLKEVYGAAIRACESSIATSAGTPR